MRKIPFAINEVVVIDNDNYDKKNEINNTAQQVQNVAKEKEAVKVDNHINYNYPVEERDGGEKLSVYFAFVPVDIKEVTKTRFETYIINDCNYYIRYNYLTAENNNWHLRSTGEVEPNTKLYIEEFGKEELNDYGRVCVQIMAYKKEKSFALKPTCEAQFRIDTVKFYKLHTFKENDFFETPAMVYTVIENDKVSNPLVVDAKQIKDKIHNIYDKIIIHQLESNPQAVENYNQVKDSSQQPFILWQLYFPKVFKEKQGFDIVIGNPPYVDSEEMTRNMPIEREIYSKKFSCAKGNWDLFVLFIEKGINLVRNNGVHTYIVPNKLVSAPYTTTLRKFMSKSQILEIKDFSNVNVFKSAAVYPVVYRLKKSTKRKDVVMDVMDDMTSINTHNIISSNKFYKDIDWDKYFNANDETLALIDKISEFPFLETLADVNGAATVNEAYLVKEFLLDEKEDNENNIKFINTGGIDKYKSYHGLEPIRYIKGKYFNPVGLYPV